MRLLTLAAILFCASITPLYAYIGPGPGLSMLGSFFTLIGGIVLALVMVLLYPIMLVVKRIRGKRTPQSTDSKE